MAYRLRIEEEPLDHSVWGLSVDVEVKNEAEELGILEVLEKHLERPARVFHGGEELPEPALERAEGLRRRGIEGKRREGARRARRRR